jgi:carboxymethylenebutenolidase
MKARAVKISGQADMEAIVVSPDGSGPFDVVVVVRGAFEARDAVDGLAGRFAAAGYLAIAPALREASALRPELTNARLLGCVEQVVAYARKQAGIATPRISVVGLGVGGFIALLAACFTDAATAVSFYPRGIVRPIRGLRMQPLIEDLRADTAPFLGLFGAADEHVRPADVALMSARLVARRVVHELIVYPRVKNGFFLPSRPEYSEGAASDAWGRTLGWIKNGGRDRGAPR